MNFTNIKLTQNQQLIVNAVGSMLLAAFLAAAQVGYQYLTQHGFINLSQAFLVFVGALWLSFSSALVAYVPSHVQQELEALREFQAEVTSQPVASIPAQPLVVIHTTGASVQSSANNVPAVAIPPRPKPQQIALTNPTGASTVPVPMPQATPDDVLGDLPASTGQPMQVNQITGVVPVYGASGK